MKRIFLPMEPLRIFIFAVLAIAPSLQNSDEANAAAEQFLTDVNLKLTELYNEQVEFNWKAEITDPKELPQDEVDPLYATMNYIKTIAREVADLKQSPITNPDLRRQLGQIPDPGYDALDESDQMMLHEIVANMSEIYKSVRLCSFKDPNNCTLRLIPEVQEITQDSNNVDELKYYWIEWREKTGSKSKISFQNFVDLYQKTAVLNGYKSASDFWLRDIEGDSAKTIAILDEVVRDLQPLFLQMHAFVRSALRLKYGPELIPYSEPYPQHLSEMFIGNSYRDMNGDWKIDLPYPEIGLANITEGLLETGVKSPYLLLATVAKYYKSIGMPPMPQSFWLEGAKPKFDVDERLMTCWQKTWKFYSSDRIQLSYCPMADEERYTNMFEAVSDFYYIKAYRDQPTLYQEEPLPNFGEAVAKAITLGATSPRFLEKVGITKPGLATYEGRINRLYLLGLRNVFLIPIFYILDKYRVDVLDGRIKDLDNCAYWDLTEKFTGAKPPVKRTRDEFDAPSKLLVSVDDQYSSPIMSIILQFQIYKSFCERTGQFRMDDPNFPLDLCDLSGQEEIGPLILNAMSLGSSKTWEEVLYTLTGESRLDVSGFLEFFKPLYGWLESINQVNKEEIGWTESKQCT